MSDLSRAQTSCLDGVRDPTFPVVGVRPLKAQTRNKKEDLRSQHPENTNRKHSTADRFTAKSRHLPTSYSRQASSHTCEAAKSKSDRVCTTFSNIGEDDEATLKS
jgi:hypothetical protein